MSLFSSLTDHLKGSLEKAQRSLTEGLERVFRGRTRVDQVLLDELEELLISTDLGVETASRFVAAVAEEAKQGKTTEAGQVRELLKSLILESLEGAGAPLQMDGHPSVYLVLGVNGSGKTTSAGKLAYQLRQQGLSVLLAAADTFRAAGIEQLQIWGERAGCGVIAQRSGADPSAVAFDAVQAARSRNVDALIIDTAGRLHTKVNLMEELAKISRVVERQHPGAPHERLMVLEAPTGQNGIAQARLFHQALGLTGMILTKLDGTAKGGIVVRIYREIGVPIKLVGTGEGPEDLQPFDPQLFVKALLAE